MALHLFIDDSDLRARNELGGISGLSLLLTYILGPERGINISGANGHLIRTGLVDVDMDESGKQGQDFHAFEAWSEYSFTAYC